jgi:hypothetical protein
MEERRYTLENFLAIYLSENEDQTILDGYELYLQNRPVIGLNLQREEGHGIYISLICNIGPPL